MYYMFSGSAYLFAINYFSFAFFLFIPFATQLFSTPVTSSNLRNQAPLFTELRLLQAPLTVNPTLPQLNYLQVN